MNRQEGYIDKIYAILMGGGYQRTLHYHNTPGFHKELYERQIEFISRHYITYGTEDLDHKEIRDARVGQEGKLPLVIGLFDGYRNNYDVMFPILEKYGMTAWFLLVTDFVDTLPEKQEKMLEPYRMQYYLGEYEDRRYAMNWEEARRISETQVIVNHSSTHYFMKPDTDVRCLKYEICHSHELLKEKLGITPSVFSWLGGAEYETNSRAAEMLRELGYQYLIGYELEMIGGEEETGSSRVCSSAVMQTEDDQETEVPEEEDMDTARLEKEIRYHQEIVERIGIFSAVPAILPFYQAVSSVRGTGNNEDRKLAWHFRKLADYLRERLSFDEWHAAHKALDVLAVNLLGEDFPYH